MKPIISPTTLTITALLLFCMCGNNNRKATLSDNETKTEKNTEIALFNPAMIDIVGNLENKKEFKLSDFGSSVQYIHLQQPPNLQIAGIQNIVSNDDYIFVNARGGLFCYTTDGKYLYALHTNKYEQSDNFIRPLGGVVGNVDLLNGKLLFFTREENATDIQLNIFDVNNLSDNPNLQPTFQRLSTGRATQNLLIDNQSYLATNTLTALSIQNGDTLFAIKNYHQPTITGRIMTQPTTTYYRINGSLMLQTGYNDTVSVLIPPNRIEPAYIMQWGDFKPDMNALANGGTEEGKFVLGRWTETERHIFIEYTEGRAFPSRWEEGKVHYHWAVYDKTTKTLAHHLAPSIPTMSEIPSPWGTSKIPIPMMFENDIDPIGMPFYPQGVNHRNEMYMYFSKEQIKRQMDTGKFNNVKLQALYNSMPDGGFCIMIVK